jgi:hypothetical protein
MVLVGEQPNHFDFFLELADVANFQKIFPLGE